MRQRYTSQISKNYYHTFVYFYSALFVLLMGCEEDRIDRDLSEATTDVDSTEILKSHFYRERFIDGYQETLCSGVGGLSMYMVEVWQYEDTVTLERRSVHDTINLYYICRHEDLLDQQYFIDAAARPGIDTSDPADTVCLPNAMRLVAYEDKNQNKSFDEEEALNQLSFCHGIFPRDAIVIFREELSHDCCPAKGWRITLGQDDNGDNILQDSEIDETMVRCNELKP